MKSSCIADRFFAFFAFLVGSGPGGADADVDMDDGPAIGGVIDGPIGRDDVVVGPATDDCPAGGDRPAGFDETDTGCRVAIVGEAVLGDALEYEGGSTFAEDNRWTGILTDTGILGVTGGELDRGGDTSGAMPICEGGRGSVSDKDARGTGRPRTSVRSLLIGGVAVYTRSGMGLASCTFSGIGNVYERSGILGTRGAGRLGDTDVDCGVHVLGDTGAAFATFAMPGWTAGAFCTGERMCT